MNLSKYKRWRALLPKVIAKQQAKRDQTHPMCLIAVKKYQNCRALIHRMITKNE